MKTGDVVWFNVVQTGSQIAGIKMGDIRTPQGSAQLVERLLGRMKPGCEVRQRDGEALMCWRCHELNRRSLLVGGGVAAAVAGDRRRPGARSVRPTCSR